MKLSPDQYEILEYSYLKNFPTNISYVLLDDYKNIIKYKDLIKNSLPEKNILIRLLEVIINKIKNKQRFQKLTLIKLIRKHVRPEFLDKEIVNKLFSVFQSLITEVPDEIAWKISALIKDIELSEDQIHWLIDNYNKSEHIQNRLLRYPKPHHNISQWALNCLKTGKLSNRLSELIGLQLNINNKFIHKDKKALIWGIHYSKLDIASKKQLLTKYTFFDNFEEIIKICEKNGYVELISMFYKKYKH